MIGHLHKSIFFLIVEIAHETSNILLPGQGISS